MPEPRARHSDGPPADRPRRRTARTAKTARDEPADRSDRRGGAPRRKAPRSDRIGATEAVAQAAAHVRAMTGRSPESVTSMERTEDGWRIGIEVVESRRVPDSTDILAVYQVDLDPDGDLLSYRREDRYPRGRFPREEQP